MNKCNASQWKTWFVHDHPLRHMSHIFYTRFRTTMVPTQQVELHRKLTNEMRIMNNMRSVFSVIFIAHILRCILAVFGVSRRGGEFYSINVSDSGSELCLWASPTNGGPNLVGSKQGGKNRPKQKLNYSHLCTKSWLDSYIASSSLTQQVRSSTKSQTMNSHIHNGSKPLKAI